MTEYFFHVPSLMYAHVVITYCVTMTLFICIYFLIQSLKQEEGMYTFFKTITMEISKYDFWHSVNKSIRAHRAIFYIFLYIL